MSIHQPPIFFPVRDQSSFLSAMSALMVFLSTLCLAIVLALGTAVTQWDHQWDLKATIQVLPTFDNESKFDENLKSVNALIKQNSGKIVKTTTLSNQEMMDLLKPWIGRGVSIEQYLPKMIDVEFKRTNDLNTFSEKISDIQNVRFMTHQKWHKNMTVIGQRIIFVAILLLIFVFIATGLAVAYATKNSLMIHQREIEILDIVGAYDSFIANQFSRIVLWLVAIGAAIGFVISVPVIGGLLAVISQQKIGMMGMMRLNIYHWITLMFVPVTVTLFSVYITKRTVLDTLKKISVVK